FFTDNGRRAMVAGSILESDWVPIVRQSPGPYFFVAEGVFVYLKERDVQAALRGIAGNFPGASIAFDSAARKALDGGNKDFVRRKVPARFAWACEDPTEIERWDSGLRLVESRTLADMPESLRVRLTFATRLVIGLIRRLAPKAIGLYHLNLFRG